MSKQKHLTYSESGVSYDVMDPLKRLAQIEGKKTDSNILASGMRGLEASRGESAYVAEFGDSYLAFVQEGLGTKNLVADAMQKITGKTYYDSIAQDTVASMVNDLITVGARPSTILAYWAAGNASWFADQKRMKDLVKGWGAACNLAGATWGGGETPTLSGIIQPETLDLGGACFGIINPKSRLALGQKLTAGDRIILFASSGIHTNGLSLARSIGTSLPKGYATKISDGSMYGEALLEPTFIYAKLIQDIYSAGIDIHYMSHITGHGWRKIMRYEKPFTYRIHTTPPVPAVLQFIMKKGPVDETEAYGNFNMGAGYALFIPEKNVATVLKVAKKHTIKAYNAGVVENGPKRVIIEPKNITFEGESLQVRG